MNPSLRSIWGYPLMLESQRRAVLGTSRIEFGSMYKGWMEKCLSAGGKEVLIKSVAQAIPTYSMSCFKLPRGLCEHINGLLQKFWWGSRRGERKVAWVSWKTMCKPKYMGGMGFRDIELFNLAPWQGKLGDSCRILIH